MYNRQVETPLCPPEEVHGFPHTEAYTRGVRDFYEGNLYSNPYDPSGARALRAQKLASMYLWHTPDYDRWKEYERGQNYAYFYTRNRQRSIERSIRAKRFAS